MTPHEAALLYRQCGYSVFPVNAHKRPIIPTWDPYQYRFATEEEIAEWFEDKETANMALIAGPMSNLLVVDADEYKHPGLIGEVEKRIPAGMKVPTQATPRGGRHYLFSYEEGFINKPDYTNGLDIRTQGGYFVVWPSLNAEGNKWDWLPGLNPFEVQPGPMPGALKAWLQELEGAKSAPSTTRSKTDGDIDWFKDGRRDNDLFHAANCLVKGGAEEGLIKTVLTRIVGSWGEKDDKWVESKVESAMKRDDKRDASIAGDVREWVLTTDGIFMTSDVYKELNLTSRDFKKAAVLALMRLVQDGTLSKAGKKRGCYCLVDSSVEKMDYINADPNDFINLSFPLGVEHKTRIFPRSVILIAGVTGTGKTSYVLDLVRKNMHSHKVHLFNSEMSAQAMHYKLSRFRDIDLSGWNFELLKWTGNTNAIYPDDVNVIDYLTAGVNAYEIQQPIQQMLERLNRGVAIILVQKKAGSQFGTGGIYSAFDASLYISLEFGNIEITKNRFREADEFPGLDKRAFTIKWGEVKSQSGWYTDGDDKPASKKGFTRKSKEKEESKVTDPDFEEESEGWEH